MKIAFVVSVLHLIIMGIVISSIINDIKEIKKKKKDSILNTQKRERKRQAKSS